MEMLHPEGNIDTQWVDNVSALLREMIASLSAESVSRRARVRAATDGLRAAAERAAAPDGNRQLLLQDVRAELHTLQVVSEGNNPAADFLSREKTISCQIAALMSVKEQEAAVGSARDAAAQLLARLPDHHEALQQLHNNWPSEASGRRLTRQSAVSAGKSGANNRHGGERNAVGAGVWKRVRLKLEGRDDSQAARRYALHDQVDHMIKEAVCSENLCMMYEGWMAWV